MKGSEATQQEKCLKVNHKQTNTANSIVTLIIYLRYVHCLPQVKVQLALMFSSFVHNSSMNELKNMKLNEPICYEMIH